MKTIAARVRMLDRLTHQQSRMISHRVSVAVTDATGFVRYGASMTEALLYLRSVPGATLVIEERIGVVARSLNRLTGGRQVDRASRIVINSDHAHIEVPVPPQGTSFDFTGSRTFELVGQSRFRMIDIEATNAS